MMWSWFGDNPLIIAVDTSLWIFDREEENRGISLWCFDDFLCLNNSITVGMVDSKLVILLLYVSKANFVFLVWLQPAYYSRRYVPLKF